MTKSQFVVSMLGKGLYFSAEINLSMGRAGPGPVDYGLTGPGLGWAWSTWARAGLGLELVSPWRTLPAMFG